MNKVYLFIIIAITIICLYLQKNIIYDIIYPIYLRKTIIYPISIKSIVNERLHNTNYKPLKILVYQSTDYNQLPKWAVDAQNCIKAYCKKYNYTYKHFDHSKEKHLYPPYWLRVIDLQYMLSSPNYDYDYIMYMDSDAVFYDKNTSIENMLEFVDPNKKYSVYIGEDVNDSKLFICNSGVYIMKVNEISRNIVNEWLSIYTNNSEKKWIYKNNKWVCNTCRWADHNYEQGAFNIYIYPKWKPHIALLSTYFLSNKYILTKSYVYHAMGAHNKLRTIIFKQVYNKIYKNN